MDKTINILILAHDLNDIGQLQYSLTKSGLDYTSEVVQTKENFKKALSSSKPDIILADYALLSPEGHSAFQIRQNSAPETPFLILSGDIVDEKAVELIKMGATDYVGKKQMDQIGSKIQWALSKAEERKQKDDAERQLRQRAEQLQKIMDLSLDVICTLDQQGRFVTIGAACKTVLGYLPEELIGQRAIALVHEEDQERTYQAIADLGSGTDMVNFENRCIRKDGTVVILWWSVRWDPEQQLGYGVARDATDIKQAEEKIKNYEKRFRTLLQNSTDGLTLLAADGTVIERSLSALKILGLDLSEQYDNFILDLVHPDDLSVVNKAFRQVKNHPSNIITIEHRLLMPDGHYKWLEVTFHNQLQEPAVGAIVLNFRDITESKTAEIALKTSEARLKEAQAIGHIGHWETNWKNGKTEWSDEIYHMFGTDKKNIQLTSDTYISFIHPDDRAAVLSRLAAARASLKTDAMTFRILQAGGQVRYVTSEVRFEVDAQERPVRLFGIHQDVTERKLSEIALEKSEEKYRNLFRLSPTPMWVYEVDTLQFLDVNEAAIKHFGYSKEEFLSMTIRDISPREGVNKLEDIATTLTGARVHYEYITRLVKKNGGVIDVDIKNSFVDLDGKEARLVIAADISERVKYLQAIKAQNIELREIAWIQSHVVRAPLARMMGLISLLQDYPTDNADASNILSFILTSAYELDDIIREIIRKTEQVKEHPILEEQLAQLT
jgi:PAS domain S-box-containing protein